MLILLPMMMMMRSRHDAIAAPPDMPRRHDADSHAMRHFSPYYAAAITLMLPLMPMKSAALLLLTLPPVLFRCRLLLPLPLFYAPLRADVYAI